MKNSFKQIIITIISLGILFSLVFFSVIFQTKKAEAGWYTTGGTWNYRKTIAIDHNKVEGTSDLTNFPVLIDITDASLQANARSDGYDILFTSSDGTTKLDHERETYTTATGRILAWVEIPTLDYNDNTIIYMYYGNSGASDQQNATGVWDSNYKWVNHWGDGTTLSLEDSTSNNYDATRINTAPAVSGKIGGAVESQSSGSRWVEWTHTYGDFSSNFTASMWMYLNNSASGNGDLIFGQMYGSTDLNVIYISASTQKIISQIRKDNGTPSTKTLSASALSTGTWYHIVYTMNSSDNVSVYVNGSAMSDTHSSLTRMSEALGGTVIRAGSAASWWSQNDAKYDEVRFSHTVRSADWIKTEYNNQSSPSTFYSVSGTDDQVADTNVKVSPSSNVKVRGGVKFR